MADVVFSHVFKDFRAEPALHPVAAFRVLG
jgi:hypothetical protein